MCYLINLQPILWWADGVTQLFADNWHGIWYRDEGQKGHQYHPVHKWPGDTPSLPILPLNTTYQSQKIWAGRTLNK